MTPLNTTPPQPPLLPVRTATRVRTKTMVTVGLAALLVAAAGFAIFQTIRKRPILPQRTIYRLPAGYVPGYGTPGYTPGYGTPPGYTYVPLPPPSGGAGSRDRR